MSEKSLHQKVSEWASSPEGKASLQKTADVVAAIVEQSKLDARIDSELMRKPMTL